VIGTRIPRNLSPSPYSPLAVLKKRWDVPLFPDWPDFVSDRLFPDVSLSLDFIPYYLPINLFILCHQLLTIFITCIPLQTYILYEHEQDRENKLGGRFILWRYRCYPGCGGKSCPERISGGNAEILSDRKQVPDLPCSVITDIRIATKSISRKIN